MFGLWKPWMYSCVLLVKCIIVGYFQWDIRKPIMHFDIFKLHFITSCGTWVWVACCFWGQNFFKKNFIHMPVGLETVAISLCGIPVVLCGPGRANPDLGGHPCAVCSLCILVQLVHWECTLCAHDDHTWSAGILMRHNSIQRCYILTYPWSSTSLQTVLLFLVLLLCQSCLQKWLQKF